MSGQASPIKTGKAPYPQPLFDTATGFMRAKHLFVAAELGIFEAWENTVKEETRKWQRTAKALG